MHRRELVRRARKWAMLDNLIRFPLVLGLVVFSYHGSSNQTHSKTVPVYGPVRIRFSSITFYPPSFSGELQGAVFIPAFPLSVV